MRRVIAKGHIYILIFVEPSVEGCQCVKRVEQGLTEIGLEFPTNLTIQKVIFTDNLNISLNKTFCK